MRAGTVADVTTEWILDLFGSEPLRSILAALWSLIFLTLAFAVIVGVPIAIAVSEQRRRPR
jgi:ABC-type spermidine/putrescine transport system permease subunit II